MANIKYPVTSIGEVFESWATRQSYQVNSTDIEHGIRLDISNMSDRVTISIFNTGMIQIRGKESDFKGEVERFKAEFESNRSGYIKGNVQQIKPCAHKYDIMLQELRGNIKDGIINSDYKVTIDDNPGKDKEYLAKINRNSLTLTVTQFNNGTLLLQGKSDCLFHDICDLVEVIAKPEPTHIVSRFISGDEESLNIFLRQNTPELINTAESSVKAQLGAFFMGAHGIHQNRLSEALACILRLGPADWSPLPSFEYLFPNPEKDPVCNVMLRAKKEFRNLPIGKFLNEIVEYKYG